MRELSINEIEEVNGGYSFRAFFVGAIVGGAIYDGFKVFVRHAMKSGGRTSTGGQMARFN